MTVGLIACGDKKHSSPMLAADLYCGSIYRAYRRWIDRNTGKWNILSAKHLVLDPAATIGPYDASLKQMKSDELQRWQAAVRTRLTAVAPDAYFVVLGGVPYRAALRGLPHCYPMEGMPDMRFGKQLAWLKRNPICRKP